MTSSSRRRRWAPIFATAIVLASLAPEASAKAAQYRFRRPFAEEPSVVSVRHMVNDPKGFVWFVQQRTLYRYDGINVFLLETLADNTFTAMESDHDGDIWLGTQNGGLMVYRRDTGALAPWRDPEDHSGLPHHVTGLTVDPSGHVWAATARGLLARIDPATGRAERFQSDEIAPGATARPSFSALLATASGDVWLGTAEGSVFRYAAEDGQFERLEITAANEEITALAAGADRRLWIGTRAGRILEVDERERVTSRSVLAQSRLRGRRNRITALAEDPQGHLWIGTESGLKMLTLEGQEIVPVPTNLENPLDPTTAVVYSLHLDRSGVIWVADSDSGVSTTSTRASAFDHWLVGTGDPRVTSITQSSDGSLWVGTYKGGLAERLPSGEIRYHGLDPRSDVEDFTAMALLVDRRERLWIGTLRQGLRLFDRETGRFTNYSENLDDPTALNNNTVFSLFERKDGRLWVGTFDGGLNLMDPATETFQAFEHDPEDPTSLSENQVRSVLEDSHGRLWVGTRTQGLNLRLPNREGFRHYRHDPDDPSSLANDTIAAITEDSAGRIWLGTYQGLHRVVIEDGNIISFERYGETEGLAGRQVFSVTEEAEGYLWLSTGQGISRFDVEKKTFTNLTRSHGLPPGGYNYNAYALGADGTLHFGSDYGVSSFHPDEISLEPHAPQIVLTSVLKLNRPIELPFEPGPEELTFSHRDSLVSFEFSLLDFIAPDQNRYEHRLEGFDEEWIDLGNHHRVNYSNLPPGSYTFRARGANREGAWSAADATLAIRVLPPPWATWWAYGLYTAAACGLVLAYSRHQARKQRREALYTQRLEREVHRRTGELAAQNEKLRYANELLEVASVTDSLTGVRNRRFLLTTIDQDIALVDRSLANDGDESRQDSAFVFILFDLDGFKEINDTYGHSAGDLVLFQIRDLLNQACRSSDTLIRWGGDEFLIVAREATRAHVEALAERIRQSVADHLFDIGTSQPVQLTCSLGFACYPFVAANPRLYSWEEVVDIADRALYVAKRHGPNMWAGIFGTEHTEETPVEDLLVMIMERPELLGAEGSIRLVTSRPTPAQTELRSGGTKRQHVT